MTTYSQIGQDIFVIKCLEGKKNGIFLDVGAQSPHHINNTYLLEKDFGWTGASIEIDPLCKQQWDSSDRSSRFILQDALTVDYEKLLEELVVDGFYRVDYLSVDLEPPIVTLNVLDKIPFNKFRFSVITYEHDMYRSEFLDKYDQHYTLRSSREFFQKHNYRLMFANTQEDWWIDPLLFGNISPFFDINNNPIPYLDCNIIPR